MIPIQWDIFHSCLHLKYNGPNYVDYQDLPSLSESWYCFSLIVETIWELPTKIVMSFYNHRPICPPYLMNLVTLSWAKH